MSAPSVSRVGPLGSIAYDPHSLGVGKEDAVPSKEFVERALRVEAVIDALLPKGNPHVEKVAEVLAAEFAAVAAEAERRAFERTREAVYAQAVALADKCRGEPDEHERARGAVRLGKLVRALTFEQVMGGEK